MLIVCLYILMLLEMNVGYGHNKVTAGEQHVIKVCPGGGFEQPGQVLLSAILLSTLIKVEFDINWSFM